MPPGVPFSLEALKLAKTRKTTSATDASRKLAIELARLAADDRCDDVLVLDLRERSPVTDYFVIATGSSDRQRRTVADDVVKYVHERHMSVLGMSGVEQPDWVLVDVFDVIVHVFDAETRTFYDLENLWGDAPRVRWQKATRAKKSAAETEPGTQ
ncbi:MAG: ribosome silencing factor [Phycisphaerae bacterium]|nr:ribosome silencing factor [Phycisphaerae bacterium]